MRCRVAILACAWLVTTIGSCASDPTQGYSSQSTWPEGIRTVRVPIFANDTYDREVEFDLADALVKEIEARTPYNVITAATADSILSGRIVEVRRDQLSKSPRTGLSEEMLISVTVDFEWRDLRTDKPLVERRSFTGQSLFVPSAPTGERIELGRFAVVQDLARDIVDEMRADW
jgi:hypothetical protein